MSTYAYAATVVRVIDGDTVVLNVDLGFRTRHESAFRLYGIDAPEVNTAGPEGEAARDHLRSLLPVGRRVYIETRKSADKYGRWLATVWLDDDPDAAVITPPINDQLVASGHARVYDGGAR